MNNFICGCVGFVAGILLKNSVLNVSTFTLEKVISLYHNTFKVKVYKKNSRIYIICKITNNFIFEENFPILKTKYRTQPTWEFYEKKGVIKIEIDNFLINGTICYEDFLNSTTLDIPFFETFSDISIYIHYTINENEYINVYKPGSFINSNDFVLEESELKKKYNDLICATINNNKPEYITKYFKKYLNNKNDVTFESLLLNYDKDIDINLKLTLVSTKNINKLSLSETI